MFGKQFYPTPADLLDFIDLKVAINWKKVRYVLEPSAGKGDIADWVQEKLNSLYGSNYYTVDCIELDGNLRNVLKGKGYPVIYNDFLSFQTFKKYDHIFMNPPFAEGAKHLLKALELMDGGGQIVCILNAETLKNPCTNERRSLQNKLFDLNAQIEYVENAFTSAENITSVEIAVIFVDIPCKDQISDFYSEMQQKWYAESAKKETCDLTSVDYIKNAVLQYNIDVDSGIRLINEFNGMKARLKTTLSGSANPYHDMIMNLRTENNRNTITVNEYVEAVRCKYWSSLFENPRFTNGMTSDLLSEYRSKVKELVNFDFSEYNIRELQLSMSQNLITGIEECIIRLFDDLSRKYSYWNETSKNIHYYNGWKTNKSWIINKKVIIPFYGAFSTYSGKYVLEYKAREKLKDIEKALRYLEGGITNNFNLDLKLENAVRNNQTKRIQLNYFTVTFYKKGTCHIEFTDEELLKKLNIFGSQQKGWLPPSYGKKKYSEMSQGEQAVIDEFQGRAEYEKVYANKEYYLCNFTSMAMLEMK